MSFPLIFQATEIDGQVLYDISVAWKMSGKLMEARIDSPRSPAPITFLRFWATSEATQRNGTKRRSKLPPHCAP